MKHSGLVRVTAVDVLVGYRVRLTFTNGVRKEVDLDRIVRGPVFEPLRRDPALFRSVKVHPVWGTLVWPNGADICPDTLYRHVPAAPPMGCRRRAGRPRRTPSQRS